MSSSNNDGARGAIAIVDQHQAQGSISVFNSAKSFETAQRIAKALGSSDLVPQQYKGNIPNCLIALEAAQRVGASPLMVMQNLHVIEGRPSWSSSFIIAALNACGRFSPLRFRVEARGEKSIPYEYWDGPKGQRQKKTGTVKINDQACIAWTYDKATGEVLEGPPVTMEMAVREGWYNKAGSKWQTMPDLMLRYRAAAFFGRLYAPDVLMGMQTAEEVGDFIDVTPSHVDSRARTQSSNADAINAALTTAASLPAPEADNDNAPPEESAGRGETEPVAQSNDHLF